MLVSQISHARISIAFEQLFFCVATIRNDIYARPYPGIRGNALIDVVSLRGRIVESRKTSIAVEDRLRVVPFEEFCEIAQVGIAEATSFSIRATSNRFWSDGAGWFLFRAGTIISSGCSRNSALSRPADIRPAGSHRHLSPPIHRPPKDRHRRDAEAARVNIRAWLILRSGTRGCQSALGRCSAPRPRRCPWSRSPCCRRSLRHERRRQQTIPPRARAGKNRRVNDRRASYELREGVLPPEIARK